MPTPLRILMIEDRKLDYQLAHRALKRHDPACMISWVQKGEDAIPLLVKKSADVAVLDYELPGMSGLETLQRMRDSSCQVPTLFMTGNGNEETAVRALKLGAKEYLVKDGTGDYLLQIPILISKMTARHKEQQIEQKVIATLKKQHEHLRATIASMGDLVFVIDKKGAFSSYFQPAGKHSLSATPEFFLSQSYNQVLPAHVTRLTDEALAKAQANNEPQHYEYSLRSASELYWFNAKLTIQQDENGRFNGATVVVRDVTEQKKAEAFLRDYNQDLEKQVEARTVELTSANEQLHLNDQLKTKLIDDMAHELRTPVTNIKLYLDLIQRSNDPEKCAHYFQVVTEQANRLDQLIATAVSFSQVQTQSTAESLEQPIVDFTDIVQQVVAWHLPSASEKGLAMAFHCEETAVSIHGDQQQLTTVITNLIKNSINYTNNGNINLNLTQDGEEAYLQISDSGIGIPADEIEHIFHRFYRGKQISQRSQPGSGIGLALSREIITLHKGSIKVTSEPNHGSIFHIRLPLAANPH
ncbi:MAG: response regulator [Chloroflexi bacterium]|nr:response regulator [Chloroflexota bacterium]